MEKNRTIVSILFSPFLKIVSFQETTTIHPVQKQLEQFHLYLKEDEMNIYSFITGKLNNLNFNSCGLKMEQVNRVYRSSNNIILFQGQFFFIELKNHHSPLIISNKSFKHKSDLGNISPLPTKNEEFNQLFNLYGKDTIDESIMTSFIRLYNQIQENTYPKYDIYLEMKDNQLLLFVDSRKTLFNFKNKYKMSEIEYALFINEMSLLEQLVQTL